MASEMLIACAFDRELWQEFGDAVGEECEKARVDIWLAPAVNLHRSPLGGRNFEYFSEDPFLTGVCACEIARAYSRSIRCLSAPSILRSMNRKPAAVGMRRKIMMQSIRF